MINVDKDLHDYQNSITMIRCEDCYEMFSEEDCETETEYDDDIVEKLYYVCPYCNAYNE